MRAYPALRLTFFEPASQEQLDHLLAQLDDFHPTAIHEIADGIVAFFGSDGARDAAAGHFGGFELLDVASEDVPDEDWAARSQSSLTPVTAGRLTIAPPWAVTDDLRATAPGPVIVIQPSMGFGTGHHATTRLCLRFLQEIDLAGLVVLDIGTGSGVLAICARVLGGARVTGIDVDPDALANARENLALNGLAGAIDLHECDLSSSLRVPGAPFDVMLANLTGALLQRDAARFSALAAPTATLIVSGFQSHEADEVTASLTAAGWTKTQASEEERWMGLVFAR